MNLEDTYMINGSAKLIAFLPEDVDSPVIGYFSNFERGEFALRPVNIPFHALDSDTIEKHAKEKLDGSVLQQLNLSGGILFSVDLGLISEIPGLNDFKNGTPKRPVAGTAVFGYNTSRNPYSGTITVRFDRDEQGKFIQDASKAANSGFKISDISKYVDDYLAGKKRGKELKNAVIEWTDWNEVFEQAKLVGFIPAS